MDYRVVYTKTAEKDLSRLEKKVAVRILKKIESYAKTTKAHARAKKLKDFKIATYRYRICKFYA